MKMYDWRNDFPIKESYRNAEAKNIEFSIIAEELPIGYSIAAVETNKGKEKRRGW
jgi:hypothetical protein